MDDILKDLPQHIALVGSEKALILVERQIIVECSSIAEASLLFIALHYTLDLKYDPSLKTTMTFLQKILIGVDAGDLPSRLSTLMEKLSD